MLAAPYLVQRGQYDISRRSRKPTDRISDALELDYMGSAEFEFGALPRSIRAICEVGTDKLKISGAPSRFNSNDRQLYIVHHLSDDDVVVYYTYLDKMKTGDLHLKAWSNFDRADTTNTNVWWDLTNNLFFTYSKDLAKALPTLLNNSIAFMDAQKK